jgi:outer membrane protein, heavy metal efflux system
MSLYLHQRPWCRLHARLSVCVLVSCLSGLAWADEPLSLEEALALASRQSAQLAAQRHGIEAAQRAIVPARELPDPKLFFGVDNLPVTTSDAFSLTRDFMTMRKIGVMQEFPRGQKRELKGQLAERIADRESAMLVDVQAALRREVAAAWVQRYFAERMSSLVAEQVQETTLQRDAVRAGLKSNRTQPADLLTVEITLQSLLDKRAQYDKENIRAKAMLTRWLGPAGERPLADFTPDNLPLEAGNLVGHIEQHPHVQFLDRQIAIAQTEASIAQAATKPDWSLELAYAQRGPSFSNMVSVQVSIDLPIFQSRRKFPEVASKVALVEQARQLKEDSVRLHLAEARAALADWEAARDRAKHYDESLLPLARERVKTTLATYRGGRGELAPVLEARRMELDLKVQRLQLVSEQAAAYAQLLYFVHAEGNK